MLRKINRTSLLSLALLALCAIGAMASGLATTGAGQDIYTFVVTDLLGGPVGIVAGVLAVGLGAYNIVGRSQFALGVPAIVGGFVLLKLESIVNSFAAIL